MMIRAAAMSVVSSRSHQHVVMAHGITSNGQALLRTWQHHHSVSLSMVSKAARLALGCSEVVDFAWVSLSEVLFDCFWCLFCNLLVSGIPIDPIPWLFYSGDWDTSNILFPQPSFSFGWSWVFANESLFSF